MKRKIIRYIVLLVGISAILGSIMNTSAVTPYASYNYDCNGKVTESSDIYQPETVITGGKIGTEEFNSPADFYMVENILYILDAGNNRIVRYDIDTEQASVINISYGNKEVSIEKATGLFVDKTHKIFVADSEGKCVWIAQPTGAVTNKITKPESEYFDQSLDFLPKKLVGDSVGNIYVQCTGVYEGLMIFNSSYEFSGFYGSDKVQTTSQLLQAYFWKRFMTSEQKDAMSNYVPSEIYNIDISNDNFIYSITPGSFAGTRAFKQEPDAIRCLNPKGNDVLESYMPKNIEMSFEQDNRYLNFIDIAYSESGYINVLDNKQGRVYQFDKNMQMVTAFSGLGNYDGTFQAPCAIETYNDKILVLDSTKCSITVFSLTNIGTTIHTALNLYNNGNYKESLEPWLDVIEKNPNFQLAYIGIGNALYNDEKYEEALRYYELGKYSEGYSRAFKEHRIIWLRRNVLPIALVLVLIVAGIAVLKKSRLVSVSGNNNSVSEMSRHRLMLYSVLHPFIGFDEIRHKKKKSYWFVLAEFLALVVLGITEQQYMGKSFSLNDTSGTNIFGIALVRFTVLLLFVISNWAFSVLLNGKATFSEICIFTSISLVPYTICAFLRVILSHVMVESESVFLSILVAVGIICSFMILMAAFSEFHEYEIGKSLFIFVVTLIGMLLIAVLGFLVYTLGQNVVDFVKTVISETLYRMNV